jgi:hypothetical protein
MDWEIKSNQELNNEHSFHALLCDVSQLNQPRAKTWEALAQHLYPGAFLFIFANASNDDLISVAMRRARLRKHYKILTWAYTIDDDWKDVTATLVPVLIFQKPFSAQPVSDVLQTGAGALNIDGARIATNDDLRRPARSVTGHIGGWAKYQREPGLYGPPVGTGRWPDNFILVHHPLCRRARVRRVRQAWSSKGKRSLSGWFAQEKGTSVVKQCDDNGMETVTDWRCHHNCAVLNLARQSGLTSITGQRSEQSRKAKVENTRWGLQNHQSVEYGDQGTAARYFFQAHWDYEVIENFDWEQNQFSFVKPVALAEWLATLLLPPAQYEPRRLLVPFAGNGNEALGAMLAGWEHVTLVEQNLNYCAIAANRLAWWWPRVRRGQLDVTKLNDWHKAQSNDSINDLPLFSQGENVL